MQSMARPGEEFGKDHGLVHEAVVTGRKVGAGAAFWAKLAHDEALFGKVVAFVAGDGVQPTVNAPPIYVTQRLARHVMGTNIFGVEEAIAHYGVKPTEAQIAALDTVPYTQAELKACKDSHLLVAVFPLSILVVREKAPKNPKTFYSYDNAWYNKQKFAKNQGEVGWHLVRKTPVVNSTNKTWDEQQVLLTTNEETPTAQIMVYAIVGHFLATGVRLFSNVYVRTSDISDGCLVCIGCFDAYGLHVSYYWDDSRSGGIGVASAWKSACR